MAVTSIADHAQNILRTPLVILSVSLVVVTMMVIGFQPDTTHIVIGVAMIGVAVLSAFQVSAMFVRRFADHVSSSFEMLRMQADSTAASERKFEYHSDVYEAMKLADSIKILSERTAEVREEMRVLEKVRSQFLANVSHELRTPIFAIQGFIETLLEGADDDAAVRRSFLEKAFHNAQRLNVLLGDLIDIARIESGEMRLSFRYFNIYDVAAEVISSLEGLAQQYGVQLQLSCASLDIQVLGDKERIVQVLSNLISNAIRYNKEGGTVNLEIRRDDDSIMVAVHDTGIGIPAEHQQRIFERFYRVDASRSRATGESGLGLAIVKHILEAHDSVPMVQSVENEGTTIRFRLSA